MSFPVAGTPAYPPSTNPSPAYTGVFIPKLWSGKILEKFYDATVLAAIANTDYAGEITNMGDTVAIRSKPTITIRDYEANQSLLVERPSAPSQDLVIDRGKYWNVIVDDVMEVQADLDLLGMWADDASEQIKITVDTDVLGILNADIDAANKGATAGSRSGNIDLGDAAAPLDLVAKNPTGGQVEVVDAIIRLSQVLDEQNIPEQGRWLIMPAWMTAMISRSELRDSSLTGDGVSMLRNGRLGMIGRFTCYMSNLLPTATETGIDPTRIYAGHSHGLTFASQLTKLETLRSEQTFGTLMRGLQVYGMKVTDGTALTELYARPA